MPTRPAHSILRLRIACPGEPVYRARARVAEAVRKAGFCEDDTDGILLAFTEALSNALRHGCAPIKKCVRVLAAVEAGRLVLTISDSGRGFHPDHVCLPEPGCMTEGGRGLFLMRAFMDSVDWICTPHGTTVRMTKCCASPAVSPASSPEPAPRPASLTLHPT